LARGASMGAESSNGEYSGVDDDAVQMPRKFVFRVDLPRIVLHPMVVARYNERRFRRVPAAGAAMKQSLEKFYFPSITW